MAVERKCRVGILLLVAIMWIGFSGTGSWGDVESKAPIVVFEVPYFTIPDRIDLCGETVPLDSTDVRERFDREFTSIVYSHGKVYLWLKRMERYFPWVERELAAKGLPDDLKFVAVAESDLSLTAVSSAGAAGPWQFMPQTASSYGMNQTATVDERYDFETSASGAFKYLKNLRGILPNWTLAVAAYNCGEGRVQDEMRKQKTNSYYNLRLPNETERYVFRILAIKEVLSNPTKYGYNLPRGAGYPPLAVEKASISLPGPITVAAAAQAAGISYREMRVLNPFLISDVIPKGNITLKVPEGRGKEFEKRIAALKAAYKPVLILHKVGKKDTLDGIAKRYNASGQNICEWNKIKNRKIRLGQVLKIYK
ncbi:MAG: transglycosylase SLT domain-containing protein [Syntrophobacteraceae bacterium]